MNIKEFFVVWKTLTKHIQQQKNDIVYINSCIKTIKFLSKLSTNPLFKKKRKKNKKTISLSTSDQTIRHKQQQQQQKDRQIEA